MPLRPAAAAAVLAVVWGAIAAPPGNAQAEPVEQVDRLEPTPAPEAQHPRGSIGYLGGNGIGELGLELGYRAWPHVALGVQAGRLSGSAGAGFGLAPLLRLSLEPDQGPYLALGATWFSFAADTSTQVSGLGGLLGIGYEWRPAPQFSVLGGAGVAFVPGTSIASGGVVTAAAGGLKPNFELGARWYAF